VAGASNPSKETAVTKNQAKRTLQGYYENLVDVRWTLKTHIAANRGNRNSG
jgi:hypothetical protein